MNLCILSGAVEIILQETKGEQVFLLSSNEQPPQLIAVKSTNLPQVLCKQQLEIRGHLVVEPVRVDGDVVKIKGQELHRPVFYADEVTGAHDPENWQKTLGTTHSNIPKPSSRKEIAHVKGPELPWEQ